MPPPHLWLLSATVPFVPGMIYEQQFTVSRSITFPLRDRFLLRFTQHVRVFWSACMSV